MEFQQTTGSLDTSFQVNTGEKAVNPQALYPVKWGSMEKVEDLILVLASLGFVFAPQHPQFNAVKHLLDLDYPIIPEESKGIKLPEVEKL